MLSNYIGQWNQQRKMLPREFVTERYIANIKINLPTPPEQKSILNYDKPIKEQKWEVPKVLSDSEYEDLTNKEKVDYLTDEYFKRKNGLFFFNCGGIEYITGVHYHYLAYWKISGTGSPDFRDSDRDFFYCWDSVVNDSDCYGLLFFTNRRDGKTEKSLNILYEYASKTEEINAGIQSQTIDDAKQIFQRLVYSWRKMPSYFKPVDSGDKNPKVSLRFEEPSIRSTKGLIKKYKKVLNTLIGYRSSSESAYDGYALWRYYCDEFGKFNDGDSYERWKIVKPTLTDGGREIRGKAIFTTTVEEIEKGGGQSALDMHNDSDPLQKGEDGRTKSGMYRLFKPAYYGYKGYTNEYGYSDFEGAKKILIAERKGLDGKDLIAIQRKYPFTIKEAFQSSLIGGTFSTEKITQQRDWNVVNNIVPRKGKFIWEDRQNLKVRFVDDPKGNIDVSWLPKEEDANKVTMVNGLPSPTDTSLACGIDSFDHRTTVDQKKFSQGAMVGFRKYDLNNPRNSNSFFLKYLDRPPKETMFYDDVMKACVYFSMGFLHENNKPTIGNYATDNGFRHYVKKTQQGDYTKSNSRNYVSGISTSGEIVREAMIGKMEIYIYDYIGKIIPKIQMDKLGILEKDINPDLHGECMFDDLLADWEKFQSTKWTDYDLSVASMLALIDADPIRKKNKLIIEESNLALSSFFKIHKL